jgi:ankyrin repeat protein
MDAHNNSFDTEATEFDGESSSMSIFDLLLHHFPEAVHQKNNYGETPLHIACRSVRRDIVTRLLDLGTAVNATDNRGRTAEDEIMDQKRVGGSSFAHLLPRRRFFRQIDEIEKLLFRAK